MFWCADHQVQCSDLVEGYKARTACGTRETNPDFRETRCSVLGYDVESMTLDELQRVKPDLEQRKKKVSRCVKRRIAFQQTCIHPSRSDQRHANVLVDMLDENLLCQDMLVRLLARLDYLENELFTQAEHARAAHKTAKVSRVAVAANLRAIDREVAELAKQVNKLEAQKQQVSAFPLSLTGRPSGQMSNDSSQIAAIRNQGTSKNKGKGKERAALPFSEQLHEPRGKLQREEIRRAQLLEDLRSRARQFTRGQDAFECLLLAALVQLKQEQGISTVFGGDIFLALETASEMTADRLQHIVALVANPPDQLVREGRFYEAMFVDQT